MNKNFTEPGSHLAAFNCPSCGAFAHQIKYELLYGPNGTSKLYLESKSRSQFNQFTITLCQKCHNPIIWLFDKMIYPSNNQVEPPNEDLNEDIKKDYNEAAAILNVSPRGAAALLRLAVQKLIQDQLVINDKNLNDAISSLVKKGLSKKLQKALDSVRIIGNNAIHPGELNIEDNKGIVLALFQIINCIAEEMITLPKKIDSIYDVLPESSKDQIERRDK